MTNWRLTRYLGAGCLLVASSAAMAASTADIRGVDPPPGSVRQSRVPSFWDTYRWHVGGGVTLCAVEWLLIIGLLAQRRKWRRSEVALRESEARFRLMAGRLIEAQEAERRRIARELHDDLSQDLALLSVELEMVAGRPAAEVAGHLCALSDRVRELSAGVHEISHQLHPSKLEYLGLIASVKGLCHELGLHHGLTVTFAQRDVPEAIPEAPALCLYRIVQEAMHNIVKHAHTDRARVELSGLPGGLRLQVSDDGVGFDPAVRGSGLGLIGMRERLALLGGQLVIDSRPGGGSRIDVRVPLPAAAVDTREASADRVAEVELALAGSHSEELP